MRKIVITMLLLSLLLSVAMPAAAEQNSQSAFSGNRHISFTVDRSELENYVNGGRPSFDLALRWSAPEWLQYSMSTQGFEITFTMDFAFISLEDYTQKLELLLMHAPNILYSEDGPTLLEGHRTFALLNFVQYNLYKNNYLGEITLEELFAISENTITLNEETYEVGDMVCIRPASDQVLQLPNLYMETELDKNGIYTRTIRTELNETSFSKKDLNQLQRQFRQVGKVKKENVDGDRTAFSVTFSACTMADLANQTMRCLNVVVSIQELTAYTEKGRVQGTYQEYVDVVSLMLPDAWISYTMELPKYLDDVTTSVGYIEENVYSIQNCGEISFQYLRDPAFSKITVHTDLSSHSDRIHRTVQFQMPVKLARLHHEDLLDELEDRLINGAVLTAYDANGIRIYEVTYSSYLSGQIDSFTKAILGKNCTFLYEESWLPFGKSGITEEIQYDELDLSMSPPQQILISYHLSDLEQIVDQSSEALIQQQPQSIQFHGNTGEELQFQYTGWSVPKLVIELLGLAAVGTIVLVVVLKIRKKKKAKPEPEAVEEPAV